MGIKASEREKFETENFLKAQTLKKSILALQDDSFEDLNESKTN